MTTILESELSTTFGLDAFRPGQQEAISRFIDGEDVVVILPTGGENPCAINSRLRSLLNRERE